MSADREILNTEQAAEFIGCSVQQLESMRLKGNGPKFSKFSPRIIRYRRSVLIQYLADHEVSSTSQEVLK